MAHILPDARRAECYDFNPPGWETPMPVLETVVVVLFGLALGAAVAVLPFIVPIPPAMLTPEFMRVWMVVSLALTLAGIWFSLRRKGRVKPRPRARVSLHLDDN